MQPRNYSEYLGGVEYASDGSIKSAKATFMRWFGRANSTELELQSLAGKQNEGIGMDQQPVDTTTLEFEKLLLSVLQNKEGYPEQLDGRANVQRRYWSAYH